MSVVAKKKPQPKLDAAGRRAVDWLMELLELPGPSGGEQPVADYFTAQLSRFPLPASELVSDPAFKQSPIRGATGNLELRLPGTARTPRRMLSAHMDTVPKLGSDADSLYANWAPAAVLRFGSLSDAGQI